MNGDISKTQKEKGSELDKNETLGKGIWAIKTQHLWLEIS